MTHEFILQFISNLFELIEECIINMLFGRDSYNTEYISYYILFILKYYRYVSESDISLLYS